MWVLLVGVDAQMVGVAQKMMHVSEPVSAVLEWEDKNMKKKRNFCKSQMQTDYWTM